MVKERKSERALGARDKIMLTAERLYALHGIDAVSIRQINSEAQQKNGSAVHYHFGSRDGLVEAIFLHRARPGNENRMLILDRIKDEAGDPLPDLRPIAEAMVRPMFLDLSLEHKTYHRRFFKQVHVKRELMQQVLSNRPDLGLRECFRLIRWRHPEMPAPILYHRYIHANAISVDSAALLEQRIDTDPGSLTQQRIDLHVECCVDSVAGIFAAPISDAAMRMVGDREKASEALERMRDQAAP